jgi:hypothetical protein
MSDAPGTTSTFFSAKIEGMQLFAPATLYFIVSRAIIIE